MHGVTRSSRFLKSFLTKHYRHYRIWKYGGQGNKFQSLFKTQDLVVSAGCGYLVTYKQNHSAISLYCVDSSLSCEIPEERQNEHKIIKEISIPNGKTLKEVSCGRNHFIALDRDGSVYSYGLNSLGQCGVGDNKKSYIGNNSMATIKTECLISKVACGLDHTIFLSQNGQVFACGWSADGQTGTGLFIVQEPKIVMGDINNHVVTKVYCGANTSFAMTDNNLVYAWGNNEYGQLAVDSNEPQVSIPQLVNMTTFQNNPVIDIAPGDSFTTFLTKSGQVFTSGFGLGQTQSSSTSQLLSGFSGELRCGLHYCLTSSNNKEHFLFGSLAHQYNNIPSQVTFPNNTVSLHTGPYDIYGISEEERT